MSKTWIIIKREYLTRVRNRSFLLLTFLMPILMGAMMFIPGYLASRDSTDTKMVAVSDRSGLVVDALTNNQMVHYIKIDTNNEEEYKGNLESNEVFALLVIPEDVMSSNLVNVYGQKQVNIDVKDNIDRQVERIIERKKLTVLYEEANIPNLEDKIAKTKTKIKVNTFKVGAVATSGDEVMDEVSSTEAAMGVAYACGFIIYMFIFMYGSMVMRGVVEEKQNRVVEVIISSVKPIQLMIGKIVGIVGVGLTQVGIWVVLLSIVASQLPVSDIMSALFSVNMASVIVFFVIYFILGYLLYSSLMAGLAAAVDSQEDMQQFMLPLIFPLVIAIMMLTEVVKSPDGALAVWGSFIPFVSPIIMIARIPFGVEWWELALSIFILLLTTMGCIWIAAKVYRTGILMYGKKPTWKEMFRWVKHSN